MRKVDDTQDSLVEVSATESIPFYIQEMSISKSRSGPRISGILSLTSLASDPKQFIGGTVYQALAKRGLLPQLACAGTRELPANTHRDMGKILFWAPSEWLISQCFPTPITSPDAAAVGSQGYLAWVAKRGVAFINPDDFTLGLDASRYNLYGRCLDIRLRRPRKL